jgi:hypothetical protein
VKTPTTVIIALNDGQDWEALGQSRTQQLIIIDQTGSARTYDLARFLRDHIGNITSARYRTPLHGALTASAQAGIIEALELNTDALREDAGRSTPSAPRRAS